jgi:hypothetical protein
MALSAGCVFELRSVGDDLNGGGFNPAGGSPGTDYSQQTAAQVTIDGATISATIHTTTTQMTLVGHTVTAADNRNIIYISAGTATNKGRYEITAVDTVNNRWTLDRSIGTAAQTIEGRMGGAVKFLGALTNSTGTTLVNGNMLWMKNDGVYTMTTTAAGPGGYSQGMASGTMLEGYEVTRGDMGSPPVVSSGGLGVPSMFGLVGGGYIIRNIVGDRENTTGTVFYSNGTTLITDCESRNCTGSAFAGFGLFERCRIVNGGSPGSNPSYVRCSGDSITGAFQPGSGGFCYENINDGGDGFAVASGAPIIRCVAANMPGGLSNGFSVTGVSGGYVTDCLAVNGDGRGFDTGTVALNAANYVTQNCFTYNNANGSTNTAVMLVHEITELTGDPFVNSAAGNFFLNNITGAGAGLRNTGKAPPGVGSYPDTGALQRQVASAGDGGTSGWIN